MPQEMNTVAPHTVGRDASPAPTGEDRLADLKALGDNLGDRGRWSVSRVMNTDILQCPPDTPLDQAATMMTRRHCSSILIVETTGAVAGIWTERDALAVDLDDLDCMTVPVAAVMSSPVKAIAAAATLHEVVTRFRSDGVRHYVVVDAGAPVGVVSQTDLIRHQGIHSFLTLRDVGSLIRREPLLVDGEDSVSSIARRLRDRGGDAAVVMVDGRPFGMVTERDVLRLVAHRKASRRGREVCSHPLIAAQRSMPLIQAHDLMERRRIRHLAVVDEVTATVRSVLSFNDILGTIELDYTRYLQALLARQDAAIQAKEERQRQIIAATQEGYMEMDAEGRIVAVNPAMEALIGFRAEDLLGRRPADLVAESSRGEQERQHLRVAETEHRAYELDLAHRDGHPVPVRVSGTTLRAADGTVLGSFAFLSDLSDIKAAERRLNALVDTVSRSNADLEAFAYVISHDLQEPLRMIASYLRLVERRYAPALDREGTEFIDFAVDGARRMQSMITDLLDYSRIDRRGRAFERCDSATCLDAALRHLKAALDESAGTVETTALPAVKADSGQVIRLFQNLVGNAIKYRATDRPLRVEVGARRGDAGDDWLFWVRDNGIGIDPAFSERIFRMFQRLHARDQYEGNGIGLAVCKRIVERHGGAIWIDGRPDHGTTVYFTLPEDPATRDVSA
jgi:PAS domain S-box-containing protein